jgi:hypothetical protein
MNWVKCATIVGVRGLSKEEKKPRLVSRQRNFRRLQRRCLGRRDLLPRVLSSSLADGSGRNCIIALYAFPFLFARTRPILHADDLSCARIVQSRFPIRASSSALPSQGSILGFPLLGPNFPTKYTPHPLLLDPTDNGFTRSRTGSGQSRGIFTIARLSGLDAPHSAFNLFIPGRRQIFSCPIKSDKRIIMSRSANSLPPT